MTSLGTVITGEGKVVRRDVTRLGLQRMCVEMIGKYPDLELWSDFVSQRQPRIWRHRYTERVTEVGCHCYLWIFWKE